MENSGAGVTHLKEKIQKAFTIAVFLGGSISLLMMGFFSFAMYKNQSIIQTMVDEYSIIGKSQSLILTYNELSKNPSSASLRKRYDSEKKTLIETVSRLESVIKYDVSLNTLIGIKNTVQSVTQECDAGIRDLEKNQYDSLSDHFAKANKYNEFVTENTRTLLQNELQYLALSQMSIQQTFLIGIVLSFLLFIILMTSMIWYARSFAAGIALPLIKLTEYAKKIALGEIKTEEKIELVAPYEEVASLVQSMQTMIRSLAESYNAVQSANTNLEAVGKTLETKNKELKEMNDIMIGRELKMIELKKEIETLKNRG
jgi:methyl-accepting chemotaxis protein